ncbi:response regulator [Bacillus marasmi]|uniref:response regulator n=1 Tax=Bacillus marasmi TaxID=1926279 RepID=UPI0011C830AE|nr:response regulator [Bacillus marasmi]
MRFFIVDDSVPIRAMLANIIEDEELGTVVGEAEDGSEVYADILAANGIDLLLIDLLMPNRDGIETVREIAPSFSGKIIMISQVETKDLIAEAYELGVEYYITKPINRHEVVSIIKKASEHLLLQKSIQQIQHSLSGLGLQKQEPHPTTRSSSIFKNDRSSRTRNHPGTSVGNGDLYALINSGRNVLLELGIIGESGNKDLLDILSVMYQSETEGNRSVPSMKDLYEKIVRKRLGNNVTAIEIKKETKAGEQRIRRTIHQAFDHIAALGVTDYANPKFEHYAATFFDYSQIRLKMLELQGKGDSSSAPPRINIKKFIQALYMEAKETL